MKNKEISGSSPTSTLIYIAMWSCVYFTAVSVILLMLQALQADSLYVKPDRFLLILPFGVSMSIGNLIIKAKALKLRWKVILHYASSLLAFYLFLVLPAETLTNPLPLMMIITVAYFLVATPILIILNIKNKKSREEAPYKSMFSTRK